MRLQARVRGLQDVINTTQRSQVGVLNELAHLQRERDRITQEKENWQKRIDLINARLEQIAEKGKWLQQLLVEEDLAPDDRGASRQEGSGAALMHETKAAAEGPVHTVTMRY